ncbi:hypothetical protein COK39_01670 [Priestia megaterium]|nr:hypothetical protein COK39_01670 [Priestia megaterium]
MKLLVLITESMYKNKKIVIFTQLLKAAGEDQKLYELNEFVELFQFFLIKVRKELFLLSLKILLNSLLCFA